MVDRITTFLDDHGWGLWAVEVAETREFIGFTGLSVPRFEAPFTPCVEVGWRLATLRLGPGLRDRGGPGVGRPRLRPMGLDEIVAMVVPDERTGRRASCASSG